MTMAQFTEQLQGYHREIDYPVLDATGVEGAWDFSFEYDFQTSLLAQIATRLGRATQVGDAADPSGTVTFENALEKQLGLRLETHKRPEPVLVIDHMEEKPTEN